MECHKMVFAFNDTQMNLTFINVVCLHALFFDVNYFRPVMISVKFNVKFKIHCSKKQCLRVQKT